MATVELLQWTVFCDVQFVHLRVAPSGQRTLKTLEIVFSNVAVEYPVAAYVGQHVRVAAPIPNGHDGGHVGLRMRFDDGSLMAWSEPAEQLSPSGSDPGHAPYLSFAAALQRMGGGTVIELGARARSGNTYRHIVPDGLDYVGVDILAGPNVDVVVDAHDLSSVLGDRTAVAVFAISVFEHLLMPWKAAVEINRVLRPGGLVFIGTHQTFPLHDEPWDFWRFSDQSWRALFNHATGFRVLETAMGAPASVVPEVATGDPSSSSTGLGYLMSSVMAEKVSDTDLDWRVTAASLTDESYPA